MSEMFPHTFQDGDGIHSKPSPYALDDWWRATAEYDMQRTVPKTMLYGSRGEDLVAIGRTMEDIGNMGHTSMAQSAELGVYFYMSGKMARAAEAFRHGNLPSYDTWFDLTIYLLIGRRIREHGQWG